MLNLALFCALAAGGGEARSDAAPEAEVVLPTPRERAATHLERGVALARSQAESDAQRIETLGNAAERAAAELQGQRSARLLIDAVADARWRAFVGAPDAAKELAETLDARRQDLLFQPFIEAELPVGFPAPTPVLEVELKSYPGYRLARTAMSGTRGNAAFWKLFAHIQSNEIAMTAPVEMTYDAQSRELAGLSMAFLYGNTAIGETGADGLVEVIDVEPQQVLSIGCRGRTSEGRIQAARRQLDEWLAEHADYVANGPLRAMGYNSPMVPDKRAYFEVQIPVRRVERPTQSSESRANS